MDYLSKDFLFVLLLIGGLNIAVDDIEIKVIVWQPREQNRLVVPVLGSMPEGELQPG